MKYYAVQKGLTPGIYTSWSECEANVKGFPGAVYKSFKNLKEAEEFLEKEGYEKTGDSGQKTEDSEKKKEYPAIHIEDYDGPIAFVDGSFNSSTKEYGYGVVVIEDTKNPIEVHLNGKGSDEKYLESMNIAGEILASETAIQYALEKGYHSLVIFHDYEGTGKWATDKWDANKTISKDYKAFLKDLKEKINLDFVWVKGHSNNYYNDMVDALAKDALGIPLEKKKFAELIHPNKEDDFDLE